MFDELYPEASDVALSAKVARKPDPNPPKRFSIWGMFAAAPKGVAAGAAEGTASTADILGAFGQVLSTTGGSGKGMFAVQTPEERKQSNAATDKLLNSGIDYNSEAGRSFRNVSAAYTPDAQTTHVAESAVFNLFRVGSKALTSAATLGNIPGAVVAGVEEGFTQADQLGQQGVDLATRTKVGAVTAVTNAVGFALPAAGKTWLQTGALALAGGPVSFVAQNAATREILQAADYSKLADQYDPLDPVGLGLSFVVPWAVGALAMRGAKAKNGATVPEATKVAPPDDLVDAARVQLVRQNMDGTNPLPGDLGAAEAHHKAYTQAMDQQAAGERVSVADIAPKIEPVAGKATDTPNFKAWFGDSKVVDDTGAPMVVYHGTVANVPEFGGSEWAGWFSKSHEQAAVYAETGYAIGSQGPNIMPVYVSIKNPLRIDLDMNADIDTIKPLLRELGMSDALYEYGRGKEVFRVVTSEKFASEVKRLGYDGIAVKEGGVETYAPAIPNQIKSAIGNSGKFDPNSGSLTDSVVAEWGAGLKKALDDVRAVLAKAQEKQPLAPVEPAQAAINNAAQEAGFNPAALANGATQMLQGGRPVAQVIGELEAGGTKVTPELQNMLVGASEFGGRMNELLDQVNAIKAQRGANAKPFDVIAQAVENMRSGAKVEAPTTANPLDARMAEVFRNPIAGDSPIGVGFAEDGKTLRTMPAREYLDMIKKEADADVMDANLLEVAANCFLSGGI